MRALPMREGSLFGDFLNLTEDFNASDLIEVIPQFHDMSFRFSQFEASLKVASAERMLLSKSLIDKVDELKKEMHILQESKGNRGDQITGNA